MDFKTWSGLLNENLSLLNREFTDAELQRLFKDIDEIKEKQNLSDNTMAILLEGFIVLKLKLPLLVAVIFGIISLSVSGRLK